MAKYDEIVASSVDRVGRSARDLHDLQSWAEDHGKTLRILSPSLVWPPPPDDFSMPIVWDVLARVAEIELRMITKRVADQRASLRSAEALVGKPPFGFRAVGEKGSKTIEPVPALVPVLREMVRRANNGDTLRSIAKWLNEAQTATGTPCGRRRQARPSAAGRHGFRTVVTHQRRQHPAEPGAEGPPVRGRADRAPVRRHPHVGPVGRTASQPPHGPPRPDHVGDATADRRAAVWEVWRPHVPDQGHEQGGWIQLPL